MIEVLFVVHGRGKVATVVGKLEGLPEIGQTISILGNDHKVNAIQKTAHGSPNALRTPKIDVNLVPQSAKPVPAGFSLAVIRHFG